MKNRILLTASLLAIGITSFAQTTPAPPTGSVPYSNQILITPSGTMSTGSVAKMYRVIASAKRVDSLRKVDSLKNVALYLPLLGGNMTGDVNYFYDASASNVNPTAGKGILWNKNTDYGKIYFQSTGSEDGSSNLVFENGNDDAGAPGGGTEGFIFQKWVYGTSAILPILKMNLTQFKYLTNDVYHTGNLDTTLLQRKAKLQNSLTADATNLRYPTVTAVNTGLALKANLTANNFTGQQNIYDNSLIVNNLAGSVETPTSALTSTFSGSNILGTVTLSSFLANGTGSRFTQSIVANSLNTASTINYLPITAGTLLNSVDATGFAHLAGVETFTGSKSFTLSPTLTAGFLSQGTGTFTNGAQVNLSGATNVYAALFGAVNTGGGSVGRLNLIYNPNNDGTAGGTNYTQAIQANPQALTSVNLLPVANGTLLNTNDALNYAKLNVANNYTATNTYTQQSTFGAGWKTTDANNVASLQATTLSYSTTPNRYLGGLNFYNSLQASPFTSYIQSLNASPVQSAMTYYLPSNSGTLQTDVSQAAALSGYASLSANNTFSAGTQNYNGSGAFNINSTGGFSVTNGATFNGQTTFTGTAIFPGAIGNNNGTSTYTLTLPGGTGTLARTSDITLQNATANGNTTTTAVKIGGALLVGSSTATQLGIFQAHLSTNMNLVVAAGTDATAMAISATNDAGGTNIPIEFRGSKSNFAIGNVGVGVTTPTESLDISGAARFRGAITTNTANSLGLGYQSSAALFASFGANSTTKGGFNFLGVTSDGSANLTSMAISATGDVEIPTVGTGLILRAPNNSRWRVTVSNTGVLTTTAL